MIFGFNDVAISEQFIVSPAFFGETTIYSDFPKIAEINQGGRKVALLGDRIVIGYDWDDVAYLYKTDGTLVKTLDKQDSSSESRFGHSVAITDNKVIVGTHRDDEGGTNTGSVFIYSADTGEFIEKVLAPDAEALDYFGSSVCASDSSFMVGSEGDDWREMS